MQTTMAVREGCKEQLAFELDCKMKRNSPGGKEQKDFPSREDSVRPSQREQEYGCSGDREHDGQQE